MKETTLDKIPYKGLVPYSENDAQYFFGRDKEQKKITINLMASRLTLLYGSSGVGKSSVLRAGVANSLRQIARHKLKEKQKPDFIVVIFSSWRDEPLGKLNKRIADEVLETFGKNEFRAPVGNGNSLSANLKEWTKETNCDLLVILDQFEEYFLYRENWKVEDRFAEEFPLAVNDPTLRANFLLSFREDALAKLDFFKDAIANIYENSLRIERLSYDEACKAIKKPLEIYNHLQTNETEKIHLNSEKDDPIAEQAFIDEVLSQVKSDEVFEDEAGKGTATDQKTVEKSAWEIETPYLQLVMRSLWQKDITSESRVLKLQSFRDLGGAKQIVQSHFDTAMEDLSQADQQAFFEMFQYLITPSSTKIAQLHTDLAKFARRDEKEISKLLEEFSSSERRILRSVEPPPRQPDAQRYEIFHDMLAGPILKWIKERKSQKEAEEKERKSQKEAEEKAKAQKQRWLLVGIMGLSIVLLVLAGLTYFAFSEKRRADAEKTEAAQQRTKAEASAILARQNEKLAQENEAEAVKQKSIAEAQTAEAIRQTELAKQSEAEAIRQTKLAKQSEAEAQTQRAIAERQSKELEEKRQRLDIALKQIDELTPHSKGVLRDPDPENNSEDFPNSSGSRSDAVTNLSIPDDDKLLILTHQGRVHSARIPSKDSIPNQDERRPVDSMKAVPGKVVAISPDKKIAVTTDGDFSDTRAVRLVDVSTGKPIELSSPITLIRNRTGFPSIEVTFGKDSNSLVISIEDKAYLLRRGADKFFVIPLKESSPKVVNIAFTAQAPYAPITTVAFSPDGRWIVTGDLAGRIELWGANGERFDKWATEKSNLTERGISAAAFDKNARMLVVGCSDGSVWARDLVSRPVGSGSRVGIAEEGFHSGAISSIAFSPDEMFLATASDDESVRVYNAARVYESIGNPKAKGAAITKPLEHDNKVTVVAFSPNSKFMISGDQDGLVRLWETEDWTKSENISNEKDYYEPVAILRGHTDSISQARFTGDNKTLITGGLDGTVRVWDIEGASRLKITSVTLRVEDELAPASITRCSEPITFFADLSATGGKARLSFELQFSDGQTHKLESVKFNPLLPAPVEIPWTFGRSFKGTVILRVFDKSFRQDKKSEPINLDVTCEDDTKVSLICNFSGFDIFSPQEISCVSSIATRLRANSNHRIIIAGHRETSEDPETSLKRSNNVRDLLINTYRIPAEQILVKDFGDTCPHESGEAARSRRVEIWFLPAGADIAEIERIRKCGVAVQQPDQAILLSTITNQPPWTIYYAALNPNANRALLVGKERSRAKAQLYDLSDLKNPKLLDWRPERETDQTIKAADFSRDGKLFLIGGDDGSVIVYDAITLKSKSKMILRDENHSAPIQSAVFSPKNNYVVAGDTAGYVKVWDITKNVADNRTPLKVSEKQKGKINGLHFTSDETYIAIACDNGETVLWETRKWTLSSLQGGTTRDIQSVAFSPDGRLLAAACDDGSLRLWDLSGAQGARLIQKLDAGNELKRVAFSFDGKYVIAGSKDGRVVIWEAYTARQVLTLNDHKDEVKSISFSADDKLLMTSSAEGRALVYDFPKLLEQARQRSNKAR